MKTRHFVAALAFAAAFGAGAGAQAQNKGSGGSGGGASGPLTIDQARAEAGGVTAGDMPGFPVTLSVPGSYRLAGNLVVPDANTPAVLITSPNVTLDLGGFMIAGPTVCNPGASPPTVCSGTGNGDGVLVDVPGVARGAVTVANGTIRGMGRNGVYAAGLWDGVRVERMMLVNNGSAGAFLYNGGVVADSQLSYNGAYGARGNSMLLLNNLVRGNGTYGVSTNVMSAGAHNVFQGNPVEVSSGGLRNLGPNLCGASHCP